MTSYIIGIRVPAPSVSASLKSSVIPTACETLCSSRLLPTHGMNSAPMPERTSPFTERRTASTIFPKCLCFGTSVTPFMPPLSQTRKDIHVIQGDCQQELGFPDEFFERILAIHVLEHLPNLPATIAEAYRVCAKDGVFSVVIPCEGGLAYGLARRLSAPAHFKNAGTKPILQQVPAKRDHKPIGRTKLSAN